ncbi:MAG: MBL fold metallo-hydrolase [Deinococcus sp.]|nr:MBL fold metallo-hydrolase [Deinococcus sp.]
MWRYEGIDVAWLGHDGFRITKGKAIYIDPFQLSGSPPKADLVLITHHHYDHLSKADVERIITPESVIVAPPPCQEQLKGLQVREVRSLQAGEKTQVDDIEVAAIPAYNVNKFRSPGNPFHPKGTGVGYIITIGKKRIYHVGDSDQIPEMTLAQGVDIALLPVSGTYVMTVQEAVKAARVIQPRVAIPMHFGAIVGSRADAEAFRRAAPCQVEILEKEL